MLVYKIEFYAYLLKIYKYIFFHFDLRSYPDFFPAEPDPDPDSWKKMLDPHPWSGKIHNIWSWIRHAGRSHLEIRGFVGGQVEQLDARGSDQRRPEHFHFLCSSERSFVLDPTQHGQIDDSSIHLKINTKYAYHILIIKFPCTS